MQSSAAGSRRVAASSGCRIASEAAAAVELQHGQLVLLDLGSDWVPPDPFNLIR
jgi:hypothetical protein